FRAQWLKQKKLGRESKDEQEKSTQNSKLKTQNYVREGFMDDQKGSKSAGAGKGDVEPMPDMIEEPPHVAIAPEEFEERAKIELHKRGGRQQREHHVDLSKEEYT